MEYVRLCSTEEVKDQRLKQFIAKGKEILVANVNNQFYCLDARCPHAGALLSEGEFDQNVLTYPWHGSRFNVTDGSVIRGPAVRTLKVYRSIIAQDDLLVEL